VYLDADSLMINTLGETSETVNKPQQITVAKSGW
jgi:hypothetical protein